MAPPMKSRGPCAADEGCDRTAEPGRRGYCHMHYMRLRNRGETNPPRAKPGDLGTMTEATRARLARERWEREAHDRARRVPVSEAVQLYRAEKAMADERNAAKRAQEMATIRDALARADAAAERTRQGGRPAAKSFRSDPADALCLSVGPFRGGAA